MSDYIKKEDAIESAKALLFCYGSDNIPDDKLDEYAEEFINDDDNTIVEVVRCKDCKWFNLNKWAEVDGVQIIVGHEICDFWGGGCKTQIDGYCSYGERKEQEHE